MLFESLSWAMLTLTLLVALPGAVASGATKKHKKTISTTRVTLETYPAMEDGEIIVTRQDSIPALEPAALPRSASKVTTIVKKSEKTAPKPQTLGASARVAKFEVVPTEKRAQIVKRMELCQKLFEVSGRAYDYRILTTKELEQELAAVRRGTAYAIQDPVLNPDLRAPGDLLDNGPDPILDAQE